MAAMFRAMVLSAGFGTRLRPLTDELPKPLLPVGDRPALAHILGALSRAGFSRAVVNTHHRAAAFDAFLPELGLPVDLVHETEILGTAGGVANARAALGAGDVLVWNGDMLLEGDGLDRFLARLLERHAANVAAGVLTTWAVAPRAAGEGTVGLDERGSVVRVRGRVFGNETAGADFIGLQVMSEALSGRLPREGCLVGDVALPLLESGGAIATVAWPGRWDDIGTPRALLEANLRWLAARPDTSLYAGPGARVDEKVALDRVLLGASARVTRDAQRLSEVVVLPGAVVRAPLSRTIVGKTTLLECS